jgi:hypothetical protein
MSLFVSAGPGAESAQIANPEEEVAGSPGWLRERAYAAAGTGFRHCLKGVRYPSSGKFFGMKPYELGLDWNRQAAENKDKMPYSDLAALNYGNGTAAIYTVFNMKYLPRAAGWFDYYFSRISTLKYLKRPEIRKILDNECEIRNNSIVSFLAFYEDKARFVYYPGDRLFHGGDSKNQPWLPRAPRDIRQGRRTDYKLIQNAEGLLAILNGTFMRHDNFSLYTAKGCRYGGFGFDFRVMMEPEPGMATAAIYEDGAIRLGSYRNLPDKRGIRMFVQNKYMVLENGEYGRDASPPHFARYADMIARTYLFKHPDGLVGYMWTMNLPPQVAAKLAKDMRITDMMILDIHSTISCQVATPGRPLVFHSYKDFKAGSFNFVPVFEDEPGITQSIMAVSRVLEKRIQPDYRREAFEWGEEGYFAVFLDGSPETARIRQPRIASAARGGNLGQ